MLYEFWKEIEKQVIKPKSRRRYCHPCEVSWYSKDQKCWCCGKFGSDTPFKTTVGRRP